MRAKASRRFLFLILVVSGAAALALQVVWTRWMSLALGSSSLAAVVVLAVFMAGIGLGSIAAGRIADRRPERALQLFAWAELGIATWALVTIPVVGSWLPGLVAWMARAAEAPTLPIALRVGIAILILAPPTLLMGASLPLLLRWSVSSGLLPARSVGGYYAANTFGGAAGVLLATFVLVARFGLARTVGMAAVADVCVAASVLVVFSRRRPAPAGSDEGVKPRSVEPAAARAEDVATFAGYFTTGFAGLGLEVIVHRVVGALVGSSVYGFAVMLAAFLLGIGAGSLVAARPAERVRVPALWIGVSLGLFAVGIEIAKRLLTAPFWFASVAGEAGGSALSAYGRELVGCLVVLLPATFVLGAIVPFAGRIAARVPERAAARLGIFYAGNTLGAVLGTAIVGFVLIPWLGTAGSLDVLSVVAGLTGVAIVIAAAPRGRAAGFAVAVAALTALALVVGLHADPVRAGLRRWSRSGEMLALREGRVRAVAVVAERNDLQLDFRRIVADQTSFASTHLRGRRYMSLLGHLPVLWAADPRSALVVCFGTGTTVRAVATHPEIARLDVAEISPEVVEFAPLFTEVNGDVLDDPRVNLRVEDGRHIVQCAREPWDVITLEPPPPRDSGVVSLYTAEFYRACRARLSSGGVMAQWCPLDSQSDDDVRMLVRTFAEAFPFALALLPVERDLLLLGSDQPLRLDLEQARRRMSEPAVRSSLAAIGFDAPADVLATVVTDRDELLRLTGASPLVTDDRPRLEYFLDLRRTGKRPDPRAFVVPPPPEPLMVGSPDGAFGERLTKARAALLASLQSGWARTARRDDWLQPAYEAVRLRPEDPFYLWSAGLSDEHLARLAAQAQRSPSDARLWLALGLREAHRERRERAIPALRRVLELGIEDPDALFTLGSLLMADGGHAEEGGRLLRRFVEVAPSDPRAADASRRGDATP